MLYMKGKGSSFASAKTRKTKKESCNLQGKCYAVAIFTNLVAHKSTRMGPHWISNVQWRVPGFMN